MVSDMTGRANLTPEGVALTMIITLGYYEAPYSSSLLPVLTHQTSPKQSTHLLSGLLYNSFGVDCGGGARYDHVAVPLLDSGPSRGVAREGLHSGHFRHISVGASVG